MAATRLQEVLAPPSLPHETKQHRLQKQVTAVKRRSSAEFHGPEGNFTRTGLSGVPRAGSRPPPPQRTASVPVRAGPTDSLTHTSSRSTDSAVMQPRSLRAGSRAACLRLPGVTSGGGKSFQIPPSTASEDSSSVLNLCREPSSASQVPLPGLGAWGLRCSTVNFALNLRGRNQGPWDWLSLSSKARWPRASSGPPSLLFWIQPTTNASH